MTLLRLHEFDTPALVIDVEAMDRNIRTMQDFLSTKKCKLRAHTKIHKSPYIAHKQLRGGSSGITCAKLGEAEVMAQSGINDILIANEILGELKTRRLARLAKYCDLTVAVDDLENARQISMMASEIGSSVGLLVDVNLKGGGAGKDTELEGILDRCGAPPGKPSVELAKEVSRLKNVKFKGLMGYEGGLPDLSNKDESRSLAAEALGRLVRTKEMIEDSGENVEVVSSAGTTSYKVASEFPGITEIQAGSYVLMDTFHHKFSPEFEYALWVEAAVISTPKPDRAILDAGGTAISADAGLPEVRGRNNIRVVELDAEHIHLKSEGSDAKLSRGDRIDLLPSNIDTTTCLHDYYVVSRQAEVEMILLVSARGRFQ